jgi:hypothetical protein
VFDQRQCAVRIIQTKLKDTLPNKYTLCSESCISSSEQKDRNIYAPVLGGLTTVEDWTVPLTHTHVNISWSQGPGTEVNKPETCMFVRMLPTTRETQLQRRGNEGQRYHI